MEEFNFMGQYDILIGRILKNAFILLEKKGILVKNEKIKKKLEGIKGISLEGPRVCFSPEYTDAFLRRYQEHKVYHETKEFVTSCISHANHIVDWDDNLRPITEADNNEMARLIDSLSDKGIYGSAPGIPQDVPLPLQSISEFISGAKNSRSFPTWAGHKSLRNELLIKECLEIMGLDYGVGVHLISPLKLEGDEVEIGFELFERFPELPVTIGHMPIIGMSTPATIVSGFTVGLAEILGGGMVFDALGTKKLGMSVNLYPFDMKYMAFVYGTPANININRLETEINREIFKTELSSKALRTMSQRVDPQAAVQKAIYTGIMAEYGKRNFMGAGSLSLDEIFSPAQLMIDCEIMSFLKKTYEMKEKVFEEEYLLLDVILENTDDTFILEPTTMDFFRMNQWDSRLFPNYLLQQWKANGEPEVNKTAREMAGKLIAGNGFELESGKARALDAIYEWAKLHVDEL